MARTIGKNGIRQDRSKTFSLYVDKDIHAFIKDSARELGMSQKDLFIHGAKLYLEQNRDDRELKT